MSEYQYVHFIAVDRLLTDKELEFMHEQSSRAEITRREFSNEYHFGDFHGKTEVMLRRGYDVHLHFANYGIRKIMLRFPNGLPFDDKLFRQYLPEDGVEWIKDKQGPAGILSIQPDGDGASYDYLNDTDEITEALVQVRESMILGDLRPLYIAWLVCSFDDESTVPPVPAGLADRTPAIDELCRFYELSPFLLDAAGEVAGNAPAKQDTTTVKTWLAAKSPSELSKMVEEILVGDATAVKSKWLVQVRESTPQTSWPVVPSSRTLGYLIVRESELQQASSKQEAINKARKIAKKLKSIADDPSGTEEKIVKLVAAGGRVGLEEAAVLFDDLAKAVGQVQAKALSARLLKSHNSVLGLKATLKRHGYL